MAGGSSTSRRRARDSDPSFIAYGMAKAAIDYFTRALAKELGPRGITVNAVAPGTTNVDTNFEALKDPAVVKYIADDTLLAGSASPTISPRSSICSHRRRAAGSPRRS